MALHAVHVLTHLELTSRVGRTTAIVEQIVIFTSLTTATASDTTTYTAANGDQLFSEWTGTTSVGPDITFSGPATFPGASGRFADASGSPGERRRIHMKKAP